MMRLRLGKCHSSGGEPGGNSVTSRPLAAISLVQQLVLRRIDAIDARAEHGDRLAAAVERAAMRGRINPARQAADDDNSGARQIERDFAGRDQAFREMRPARRSPRRRSLTEARDRRASRGRREDRRFPRAAAGIRSAEMDAVHAKTPWDCALTDDDDTSILAGSRDPDRIRRPSYHGLFTCPPGGR